MLLALASATAIWIAAGIWGVARERCRPWWFVWSSVGALLIAVSVALL